MSSLPASLAQKKGLSIAEAVIFGALFLFTIYIIRRHGKNGMTTWPLLNATCMMAFVHGLTYAIPGGNGRVKAIVESLATSGVIATMAMAPIGPIYEASMYLYPKKIRWNQIHILVLHIIATIGISIGSSGGSPDEQTRLPKHPNLQKAGYLMLLAVDALVVVEAAWLRIGPLRTDNGGDFAQAVCMRRLINTALAAVPFSIVRVLHQLFYAFNPRISDLDPERGSLATLIAAVFLPQLAHTLVMTLGGWLTRDISSIYGDAESGRGHLGRSSRRNSQRHRYTFHPNGEMEYRVEETRNRRRSEPGSLAYMQEEAGQCGPQQDEEVTEVFGDDDLRPNLRTSRSQSNADPRSSRPGWGKESKRIRTRRLRGIV